MSDLVLVRDIFTTKMTIGVLYYNDVPLLLNGKNVYVGEDVCRAEGIKIPKETAIPAGDYWIEITFSERFQRMMPLIYNQEDLSVKSGNKIWTGIRQHNGNTEKDTDSCQLMGLGRNGSGVYSSHDALAIYYPFVMKLVVDAGGKIPYQIINRQL